MRVEHVVKHFPLRTNSLIGRGGPQLRAVDDVSLEITPGETLGLVGETGCGKSTLARCMTRLYDLTGGKVFFDGQDISELSRRQLRPVRREIQMIFQDPYGSLNPRRRVGSIIGDAFSIHGIDSKKGNKRSVQELMELVGLNPEHYNRFPAEFSGGQRQRIGVARALALKPKMIVCDEPVSALDVSIQAQVINLLKDLQAEFGLTYVFISHDLSVVRHVSDRIAVMYLGKVIEISEAARMLRHQPAPLHPGPALGAARRPTPTQPTVASGSFCSGDLPSPLNPPTGCRFHPRCPKATDKCVTDVPVAEPAFDDPPEHPVACWHPMTVEESLNDFTPEITDTVVGQDPVALETALGASLRRDEGTRMSIGRLTPDQGPDHAGPATPRHRQRTRPPVPPPSAIQGRSPWALSWAPASQGQGRDDLARRHRTRGAAGHHRAADRALDRPRAEHPVPRQRRPGRERPSGRAQQPVPVRHRPARPRRPGPDRLRRANLAARRV